MAWQQSDLDAIEVAIACGAQTVKFSDKEVTYRSIAEMMQVRDLIREKLGLVKKTGQRIFTNYDSGF